MKNIDLPPLHSSNPNLDHQFEIDSLPDSQTDNNNSTGDTYGLILRERKEGEEEEEGDVMLRKLKSDLRELGEDQGEEEYREVPVEGFAAALLGGYGWKEGGGIGKCRRKVEVRVVERKMAREGIGFKVGNEKEGERRGSLGFRVGEEVRVIGGRDHVGKRGRVVRVSSDKGSLILEVSRGGEDVRVRVGDVVAVGSKQEEGYLRKEKESRSTKAPKVEDEGSRKGDKRRGDENREHGCGTDKKESKRRSREEGRRDGVVENGNGVRGSRTEEKGSQVPWLRSHIRVRIISKELKSGRLYLKKGEVVDVVGPTSCDISMDESTELVQGVDQSILETALPKRGGPVLVLLGKHKGVYGSLVERDMERELGVVQDADTHDLLNVKLEQIAEYVGDPSYLGY